MIQQFMDLEKKILVSKQLQTPLGSLVIRGDEERIYSLEFGEGKSEGNSQALELMEQELDAYFRGKLRVFRTPICLVGTPFQKKVWEALRQIPLGKTCSYRELAIGVGKPSGFRAVAQANGVNRLAIVVPCHRVIYADGTLGGYSGGLDKKEWLLKHEALFR